MCIRDSFSTQTSYENQTKKAITNKFVQDAMSEFLREQLQVDVYKRQSVHCRGAGAGGVGAYPRLGAGDGVHHAAAAYHGGDEHQGV